MADETDVLFEQWRAMREQQGEHIELHELYHLVAEARGVVPADLDLEERQRLAARALEVIWPGFEQVAPVHPGGRIEIVPSDPSWPGRFAALHDELDAALGSTARRIDHIGSTSVPGLDAKPIIDVQVSVDDLVDEASYVPACESLGFELYSRDDAHRFFSMAAPAPHDRQVHVCVAGGLFERDHLLFRDYLRANDDARVSYAAIKRSAAARWADDRLGYTYAKSDHILDLLVRANAWAEATGWSVARDRRVS